MTRQHFNGPVEQVAAGNIYNKLSPAVCPCCAQRFMTEEQTICYVCKRRQARAGFKDAVFNNGLLFFSSWGFCHWGFYEAGFNSGPVVSFLAAALMTHLLLWGIGWLDERVKANF